MKKTVILKLAVFALLFHAGIASSAQVALDDARILAIFDQANTMDIYIGWLGAKLGHSKEVRDMGKMVSNDHIAV